MKLLFSATETILGETLAMTVSESDDGLKITATASIDKGEEGGASASVTKPKAAVPDLTTLDERDLHAGACGAAATMLLMGQSLPEKEAGLVGLMLALKIRNGDASTMTMKAVLDA